jgi:hypothetical protein
MSPPRDPQALSVPKIVFAPPHRKGGPRIEEGSSRDNPRPIVSIEHQDGGETMPEKPPAGLDHRLMADKY